MYLVTLAMVPGILLYTNFKLASVPPRRYARLYLALEKAVTCTPVTTPTLIIIATCFRTISSAPQRVGRTNTNTNTSTNANINANTNTNANINTNTKVPIPQVLIPQYQY